MRSVLIADDEAIERKYLKSLFEKHPERYRVAGEAAGGREAVELALAQKPDVLILDINMPGMNGLEAGAEIRAKLPGAVILLNTAYAEFEFAQKAVAYQLDAYLLKPSTEAVLLETIEHCFAARFRRAGEPAGEQPPAGPLTQPVAEYIKRHYSENLSLKELADFAHFSPSYLSHLFHAEHGLTIKAYISRQRIARAEELLRESGLSVKEVCARCGFANISHFNRVFKQTTGRAPGEYRKEL